MVTKWKKKPAVVEAVQFNGENIDEIREFVGEENLVTVVKDNVYSLITSRGKEMICKDNYVVKGVTGRFYTCTPLAFHSVYEKNLVWDENI